MSLGGGGGGDKIRGDNINYDTVFSIIRYWLFRYRMQLEIGKATFQSIPSDRQEDVFITQTNDVDAEYIKANKHVFCLLESPI